MALHKKQKSDLSYHNKNKELEPTLKENESVFIARQGIKSKTQDKFKKGRVIKNHQKTFIDNLNRKIHKTKLKRTHNINSTSLSTHNPTC